MNFKGLFKATLVATALTLAGPAAAADSAGERAASAVGHWIAMQGNQALRDIREDLKDRLADSLKPLLPTPDTLKAASAPATDPAPTR